MADIRTVAVVDDDIDALDALCTTMRRAGLTVRRFHGAEGVLDLVHDDWPGVVLTDMRMPRYSGIQLLRDLKEASPSVPVVLISGQGDVAAATEAMKLGAEDFVEKPIEPDLLVEVIRRAITTRSMTLENRELRNRAPGATELARLLPGRSLVIRQVRDDLQRIAAAGLNTLIYGELGTGKTAAANALVALMSRQIGEVHVLDCAAIEERQLKARIVAALDPAEANNAIIIHDVQALPMALQQQLAQAGDRILVVATTDTDLATLEESGRLSPAFLYFVNKAHLSLPPLRTRPGDISQILKDRLQGAAVLRGMTSPEINDALAKRLQKHPWHGNLKELDNIVDRLVGGLSLHLRNAQDAPASLDHGVEMARFERDLIASALTEANGSKSNAAKLMGIPRKRLYLRMKALDMQD